MYEGVVKNVRGLAPLFAGSEHNVCGKNLILLTKTANTHYLADITPSHRSNVVASFSLNPEPIADLWEGKWPDTGERITSSISKRLEAVKYAQDSGFEVKVRGDPILTPDCWEEDYATFLSEVKSMHINFHYWT